MASLNGSQDNHSPNHVRDNTRTPIKTGSRPDGLKETDAGTRPSVEQDIQNDKTIENLVNSESPRKHVHFDEDGDKNNTNGNSSKTTVKMEEDGEGTGRIESASIVSSKELSIKKKSDTSDPQERDISNISAFDFDLEGKRHNLNFESEIFKWKRDCRLASPVANITDNNENNNSQMESNENLDRLREFKIPHPYDPMGMSRRNSERRIFSFPVLAQFAIRPPILGGQPSLENTGVKMELSFLDRTSKSQDRFFQGSARAKTAYSLAKRMDLVGALKVANSNATGLAEDIVSRTSAIMQEGLVTARLQAESMMGNLRYDLSSYDHTARSIALAQMIQLKKGCTISLRIGVSGPYDAIGTDVTLRLIDDHGDIDTTKYNLAGDGHTFARIGTLYLPVIPTDSTGEPDMDRVRQLICAYSNAHFEVCLDKNVYTTQYKENIKTAEGYRLYPKKLLEDKDWLVPLYAEGVMTKATYQNLKIQNGHIAAAILPARTFEVKGKKYNVKISSNNKNNDPGSRYPWNRSPVIVQPAPEVTTVDTKQEVSSSSHQPPNFIHQPTQPNLSQTSHGAEKDCNTLEDLIAELISNNELDLRKFADATFPSLAQIRNCHDRLRKAEKANQVPARMPTKSKRWCWRKGTEVRDIKKVIKRHFGPKGN